MMAHITPEEKPVNTSTTTYTRTSAQVETLDPVEAMALTRVISQHANTESIREQPHWLMMSIDENAGLSIGFYCLVESSTISHSTVGYPDCHLEQCSCWEDAVLADPQPGCSQCQDGMIVRQQCLLADWFSECGALNLATHESAMLAAGLGSGPIIVGCAGAENYPRWHYPELTATLAEPNAQRVSSGRYGHYLSWRLEPETDTVLPVLECTGDENAPCRSAEAWAHYNAPSEVVEARGETDITCAVEAWFQDEEIVIAGAQHGIVIPTGAAPVEITHVDSNQEHPAMIWRYVPGL